MSRVLVAMSGGVDSAVAAALLVESGHDVTGVHLKLADVPLDQQVPGHGCCTLDDAQDARRAAQVLGIPFYVWDLSEVFRTEVQEPFAVAYATGVTPNPCVTCNERVKYAALLDRARRLGFDFLATGHHARLRRDGDRVRMFRAADPAKDQTYVLYVATADELAHTLLPVGEMTKDEVRRQADARGLRVAAKPDSYDVCFIPDGDTAGYLADRLPTVAGDIVDLSGEVLGQHAGVWRYTVGQRRGLGLGTHERRFVVDVDAVRNRVVVGPRAAIAVSWAELGDVTWIAGDPPTGPVEVQVRAHGRPVPGRVVAGDTSGAARIGQPRSGPRARVELDEPVFGLARGQSAVVYAGEECLGGGRVVAAERPAALADL
ncbi:MAG: tRNA 2-thiouridine(34) synthase MnmA [Actinobacteria bacterium]|nr:tRNA 2-thiouridine(34) synthase MnmA [Actinomycetota bacterium]